MAMVMVIAMAVQAIAMATAIHHLYLKPRIKRVAVKANISKKEKIK